MIGSTYNVYVYMYNIIRHMYVVGFVKNTLNKDSGSMNLLQLFLT